MLPLLSALVLAAPPSWQDVPLPPEGGQRLAVVVFLSTDCPLAKLYTTRVNELHKSYRGRVHFVGVLANPPDSQAEIDAFVKQHAVTIPLVKDQNAELADRFGATRSTEAFLLDKEGVRYQGRIDDQYAPGHQRPAPTHHYVRDALDSLLADKPVATPRTEPVGCLIDRPKRSAAPDSVTYSKHIAPILFRRCLECHRRGQVGPFPLTSYMETAAHSRTIGEVIRAGQMPPWGADPRHGRFANDRSLTADEKRLIFDWIARDCPEGDPADLSPLPAFPPEGWAIKPDVIYSMSEPFTVPAEGILDYQRFVIDPGLQADGLIAAIQIRPGNRTVAHHATLRTKPRNAPTMHTLTIGPLGDSQLAMFVPGQEAYVLPPGMAKRLPADRVFVLEIHYVTVGSAQTDQTQIGIVWADPKTVEREIATLVLVNTQFEVRPFLADQPVANEWTVDRDLVLHALFPHMHLRGKSMKFEAEYPDGSREVLLNVPRYDFSWQHRYVLAEPLRLPAGTTIHCTGAFDNSPDNPNNPDPSATVHYGDQTTDEMFHGYLEVSLAETPTPPSRWEAYAVLFGGVFGIIVLCLWRPVVRRLRSGASRMAIRQG
jgi:hypothetical protein